MDNGLPADEAAIGIAASAIAEEVRSDGRVLVRALLGLVAKHAAHIVARLPIIQQIRVYTYSTSVCFAL